MKIAVPIAMGWFGGLVFGIAAAFQAHAQQPILQNDPNVRANGEGLYNKICAACHDHPDDRAPTKITLMQIDPDEVVEALTTGAMKPMAGGLTTSDISDVALSRLAV